MWSGVRSDGVLPGLPDAGSEVEPADGVGDAVPVGDESAILDSFFVGFSVSVVQWFIVTARLAFTPENDTIPFPLVLGRKSELAPVERLGVR